VLASPRARCALARVLELAAAELRREPGQRARAHLLGAVVARRWLARRGTHAADARRARGTVTG
jgi:hypothetical protein